MVSDDVGTEVELAKSDSVWVPSDIQKVSGFPSGFHSLECHEYWVGRWGRCPYCCQGSKAVCKSLIVEYLGKR